MRQRLFVTTLAIVIVLSAAILGIYIGTRGNNNYREVAEGIVLKKEDNTYYNPTLITSYDEYIALLEDYDIHELVFLTAGDLENNDYIIDFINYNDSLEFTDDIGVEVLDTGINLTYYVNEEIDDSDEILMFFIPIDDGVLGNFIMGDREFVVK
ncbi:MAG TPA: hypothetical protein IAB65_02695 [Candidatus Onthocola stercorigallinarum]|nr:hypothetical protein [Candidatus Onthocola stercorigallinarum]